MSIRKLTDEQFADGTTIDGDRLDLTIQDLEEFINSIPGGDIKTRWVPQTVHVGYLPLTAAADTDVAGANILPPQGPWLPVCNKGSESNHTADIYNRFRVKGTRLPYMPPVPELDDIQLRNPASPRSVSQVSWSTSLALGRPAILYAVNAYLLTDVAAYQNSFKYGAAAPPGRTATDFVKDVQLTINLDNPFSPENQKSHAKVFQRREFSVEGHMMRRVNGNPTTDMTPGLKSAVTFNFHQSLAFEVDDLRIPLPLDTRMRFALTLPSYPTPASAGGVPEPWFDKPFTFIPSLSFTILEPMLND